MAAAEQIIVFWWLSLWVGSERLSWGWEPQSLPELLQVRVVEEIEVEEERFMAAMAAEREREDCEGYRERHCQAKLLLVKT